MNNKDEIFTTKSEYWTCDICGNKRKHELQGGDASISFPGAGPNLIEGQPERFCFQCWGKGIMWAMKQAQKEK